MENNHEGEEKKHQVIAEKVSLESTIEVEALGSAGRTNPMSRLTPREMDSLTAISDALLPSIDLPPGVGSESIRTFYATSASMLGTPEIVGGYMSSGKLQHAMLGLLRFALWMLSTWYGTFILCGTKSLSREFPYFRKLSDVEADRKEDIVRSWSVSSIYLLRQLFRGMKFLVFLFYFTQVNEKKENPTWKALGYCGPEPELEKEPKLSDIKQATDEERVGPLHKALVHMDRPRDALTTALAHAGLTLTTISAPGRAKPIPTIRCDAVVVGSGSGGGVVAGVLAQAGYKVLVLEKGGYFARGRLSLLEGAALDAMYEGCGLLASADMGVTLLSGSTVGGGSAINWSASLRTPDHVMQEWRDRNGLDLFGSVSYEQALDAVCTRMGVQPCVGEESLNNAALRRGCAKLGYPVRDIPRNAPVDHDCGWCCFGCRYGRKQATSETWLVDLARSGNGLILPGCKALKVLHENKGRRQRHVATGVLFEFDDGWSGKKETCVVESQVTVVACGALGTPVLLKNSGLKNPNIGKHLHLHPVVMVSGYFPESGVRPQAEEYCYGRKKSYEGSIMTAMSMVASSKSAPGYGAVIQTPSLHPGLFSVVTPWVSGADFKERMTRFARTAHIFALARDQGAGSIDASGIITYKLDPRDEEVLKKGIERMVRIMAAAGAAEVGTQHCEGDRLDLRHASTREFEGFVRRVARRGLRDLSSPVCSAHQMGSCRMGVEPKGSAVDARGEAWEVEGLYVADASVFPTALGVNPMVTVQAIAYCTAQSVLEVLKRKINKGRKTKGNRRD